MISSDYKWQVREMSHFIAAETISYSGGTLRSSTSSIQPVIETPPVSTAQAIASFCSSTLPLAVLITKG